MESEIELYLFDHHRYRFEVVPALVKLLRTGTPAPWLVELLREPGGGPERPWARTILGFLTDHRTDLVLNCGYLGDDLRLADAARRESWSGAAARPCPSRHCPQRDHCPIHEGRPEPVRDALATLFTAAVARCRLGPAHQLRAGAGPRLMPPVPDDEQVDATTVAGLNHLFAALNLRGAALACGIDGTSVLGWLDPVESAELADHLRALGRAPAGARARPAPDRPGQLSTIRVVSTAAAQAGHGLLGVNAHHKGSP